MRASRRANYFEFRVSIFEFPLYSLSMRFFLPLLLLWGFAVFADDLQPAGGFEAPVVTGRTPRDQGGDPSNNGRGPGWISFRYQTTGAGLQVVGGLTNEVNHTGGQSLYIRFNHADRPFQSVLLVSNFIPVIPGTDYKVGIWGRTDAKDPINTDGRSAYLKLEVDYFAADGFTSIGEPRYEVQPIPGSKDHAAFFRPDAWAPYFVKVTPPPGAVFAQVIWRWETGSDPGQVTGISYWDDAAFLGPPAPNPTLTPVPGPDDTPAPDASASPAGQ